MRAVIAVAALLAGLLPATAQEKGKRIAIPTPLATYSAMPVAERMAIQSDLLWTGHYDGVVDGEFTERSIAAIRAFQAQNKTKQTGVLNPQEREVLSALAKKEREAVGWKVVEDTQSGARVGFPAKLLPQWVKNKLGSRWSSERGEAVIETFRVAEPGATLASVFDQQKREPERKIESSQLRGDSFVMSGLQGLKKFYARAEFKNGEVRGLTVLYDQAMHGTMARIADAVRSTFVPFSRAEKDALKTGALTGKVEYGTGWVVSEAGHILTPRQVTDGCAVIVVPGLGNPEIVAEDEGKGLALLRVHGGRKLAPLPITAEAASGSDLTLVGIADPKAQSGRSMASTARAKLAATASHGEPLPLASTPTAGFSGAAAFDPNNRLLGVVQFKSQLLAEAGSSKVPPGATVIPAQMVQDFLNGHGVRPVAGSTTVNDAKASALRVICVRQ